MHSTHAVCADAVHAKTRRRAIARTPALTRALVDTLPSRVDEVGPPRIGPSDPNYYDLTADSILDRLTGAEPLWIFAIGSLLWNPRFEVTARRAATINGWRRAFCLGPTTRGRGCPSRPGLMLSLDVGDTCPGVALQMKSAGRREALIALLKTEPPTPPTWVEAASPDGSVHAIAFTAHPSYPLYRPEPPIEEVADILSRSVGERGTMAEYVLNTVIELEKAGVHDPYLWRVQEMMAERLHRQSVER